MTVQRERYLWADPSTDELLTLRHTGQLGIYEQIENGFAGLTPGKRD
jgi:hypothetical protein